MTRSRQIVAVLFSLLIASSMVVVPASAAFTQNGAQSAPRSGAGSTANLDLGATATGASALDHTTPDDLPDVGGQTPRDVDGDGRYEDVTGDGSFTNSDIIHFFSHQHLPPVQEKPTYFDYNGDGDVGQADVTLLFDALSADQRTDVIVPPEAVDVDEDGLTDRFEANVAGTDPHDANSNSTLTTANESTNDALDGAEDLSGNGISLAYAAAHDLDPVANDTDGDGLSDRVEIRIRDLDPAVADTDGDRTSDGEADLDGDGLSNADEVERGTSLRHADSDADGIEDGEELGLGTDPLAADTDEDGLDDGLEERFGTDATSADSDGDGTPDGSETFDVKHTEETTGVTATAIGTGATPTELSLEHLPRYDNTSDATAARTVLVSNVDAQKNVTVRLPVTTNVSAEDLSVYTRKPERNATWQEHGGEYDAAAGVATAELSGDREVTVLNATTWKASQSVSVYEGESIPNLTVTCEGSCAVENGSIIVGPDAPQSKDTDSGSVGALSTNDERLIAPTGDIIYDPIVDTVADVITDDSEDGSDDSDDTSTDTGDPAPRYPPDGYDAGDSTDTSDDEGSTDSDGGDSSDSGDDGSDSPNFGGSDDDDDNRDDTGSDDTGDNSNTGESSSTATVSIPVDPEAVTLTIGYSIDGGTDDATITVDGASNERRLSADVTYGDIEILSADVSEFAGEEVTVSVDASDSTASIEGLSPYRDSDGDGLVNDFETNETVHPQTRQEFTTDPYLADTDGDGIDDGEEVSTSFNGEWWEIEDGMSNPSLADTDGDGVTDDDEIDVWETDPSDPDTSGDGLNDQVDPKPLEENTVPKFSYSPWSSEDRDAGVKDIIQIEARPTGVATGVTVEVEASFGGDNWEEVDVSIDEFHDDGGYNATFVIPMRNLNRDYPEKVRISVSDNDDNTVVVEENLEAGTSRVGSAVAAGAPAAAVVTRPEAAVASGGSLLGSAVATGGLLVLGGFAYYSATSETLEGTPEGYEDSTTVQRHVPSTGVEQQWQLAGSGAEIALPAGAIYDAPTSGVQDRGFGWEYVDATTSLTQADLEHVIEDPTDVIEQDGEVRYVIGDATDGIEKVILGIISGTLVAASQSTAYNDDCGSTVRLDKGNNPEHAIRNGKPINELSTIVEVIENPTRIIDAGAKRYYILRLGTNKVLMISTQLIDETYQVLKTTLTRGGSGEAFRTVEEATDEIRSQHNDHEIVHDPDDGVEC